MTPASTFRALLSSAAVFVLTALALAGCSDATGTATEPSSPSTPTLAARDGEFSGRTSQGSHTNLLDDDEDPFVGPAPLAGVVVRLVDSRGVVRARTTTDRWGVFIMRAPAAKYVAELKLRDGAPYLAEVRLDAGGRWVMLSKFEYVGTQRVMNAKLFPDANGDGKSDTGVVIQILGRLAGDLTSGVVNLVTDTSDQLGLTDLLDRLSPLLPLWDSSRAPQAGRGGGTTG